MSADICLYKLSDAKFQNKGVLSLPMKEFNALSDEEIDVLWETKDSDRFEDGEPHELVDLTYYKLCYGKTRGWRRARERFNRFPIQSGRVDGTGDIHHYIVADCLGIYSGLYLNGRYYKKDCWLCICTTWKEVVNFFEKYGAEEYTHLLSILSEQWEEDKTFLVISY